jgi:hypothetical protein
MGTATRPLVCRILMSILLLLFMQGSLARPDFDRLRAGSEFLRRRAPVSRLEPLRYNSTFIYSYTHVPHVSSCRRKYKHSGRERASISSNGNPTDLCRLYRYKEYLREEIVTENGPQVIHLKYDVTIAKSTRILDDMKGIQSVKCTNSSLTLTLTPDLNASFMSQEFQLGSVVAGGSEWGCLSSIVGGVPATAMDFTRKVRSVSTDINLHVIVLGTQDTNPFYAFEEQDIDIWSENVVTPDSNLRSKSSSRSQTDLPVSDTSSTRSSRRFFGGVVNTVGSFFGGVVNTVVSTGEAVAATVVAGAQAGYNAVAPAVSGAASAVSEAAKLDVISVDHIFNPRSSILSGEVLLDANSEGTTTRCTASGTSSISLSYLVDVKVSFRFMIRAGTSLLVVPTLFQYESWINEEITFLASAKATVSANYQCSWTKYIVKRFPILAIPPMNIGGISVPLGLYGNLKMEMPVRISGMFEVEVGMEVSRTRKYGSRLSNECTAWACQLVPIDEGTAPSYDPIFDWKGKVVASITPSLEFGLSLECGIALPRNRIGFELYSGLKLYLEATFSYGLGSETLQSLPSSEVDKFWLNPTRETCQKFHEAEVKVEAGLRWTGVRGKLEPFYPEKSLIGEKDVWGPFKLFIACYNSGGTWSACASEGGQCSCPGGIVRFGANGVFAPIKVVIGTTSDCNSNVFGDPIPGTRKSCACSQCAAGQYLYQPVTTATVTCSGGCLCQPSSGTSSGTISDGQGNYGNNAQCTWFIASSGVISLFFSSFNTELDWDFVTIWRCTSKVCFEQLAELSGNSVSESTEFRSSTGYMRVDFESDGDGVRPGFVASWKVASPGPDVECTDCPTNSNSPARLSSVKGTSCTCNAGSTGPNGGPCEPCVAGKYKTLTGTATCTNCGAGTYSSAGSTACMGCGAGTYSAAVGATASWRCSPCPSNSISPVGSSALTSCTCSTGSTGPNGGLCAPCAAGKYKELTGTVTCTPCGAGTYSAAVGATAISKCSACPPNSNSPAGSAAFTSCTCNTGSTGPNGGPCAVSNAACVAGKYKTLTGTATASPSSTCIACPPNSNSPAGSESLTSCTCNAGSTPPVLLWSTRNIVGQFGLESVTLEGAWGAFMNDHAVWPQSRAMNFEVTTTINVPSTSVYELKGNCDNRGMFYVDGNLVMTVVGFSTPTSTQISLTAGQHTLRIVGEDYGGAAGVAFSVGGPCVACVAGKYKTLTGTATCTDCGAGTYSAAVGASTSSTCSACPSNSNSPAGSAALTSCTCNTGSTGPNGGPCATVICVRLCLSCL